MKNEIAQKSRRPLPEIAANLVRGGLIGAVETMPGVSGGTVALAVMIYERLIASASSLIVGVYQVLAGIARGAAARREGVSRLRQVDWLLVVPLLGGMIAGILLMSQVMEDLSANHPVLMRAAFFGMVLVSLLIPIRLAGRWRRRDTAYAVLAALIAGIGVSLPPQTLEVTPLTIIACAAVAVCALALPGLSGSFLLLALGLYEPTLAAVNNRELGYLGLFMVGAVVGGVVIVLGLRKLLAVRHHLTMVVVTGLMAGGLRALWPWQDESRNVVAADPATLLPVVALALGGALIVGLGVWAELRATVKATVKQDAA